MYETRPPGAGPIRALGLLFLLAVLALVVWRFAGGAFSRLRDPDAAPRPVTARGELADDEQSAIELFGRASPAVVFITSISAERRRFSLNVLEIPRGNGSGFIWDAQGYVVTNFHVIESGNTARVTLSDRSTWKAAIVGVAPDKDLAVLRIDAPASKLAPILVGESAGLKVGQKVFAIGNPFGLDQSMTMGIISGLDREIQSLTRRPIQGVIQTDAAINPGNSGGPLLDSAGRLIGVNTAIYSPSGTYAGVGFAVPVDTVNQIVPQLIAKGKATRAGLGIQIGAERIAERLVGVEGVPVMSVTRGSAAERAGMRELAVDELGRVYGDVIVAVEGTRVKSAQDLYRILDRHGVGDTVRVRVRRDDAEELDIPVMLQALPD